MSLLFVYGTLMTGLEREWREVVASRKLGRASIAGRLYDFGIHPGAVADGASPPDRVHGLLYELSDPDQAFTVLDPHEEYDPQDPAHSVFVRREVDALDASGRTHRAWVYFFNGDVSGRPRITSGAWTPPRG